MTQESPPFDYCLFCDDKLQQGENSTGEHVFLAALGGRTVTSRAICHQCNNHFSTARTGKADEELARYFEVPRNLLSVWSGRDGQPPTLRGAGSLDTGQPYDLAPGGVPLIQGSKPPSNAQVAQSPAQSLVARTPEEAARLVEIMKLRGHTLEIGQVQHIQQQVPPAKLSLTGDVPSVYRAICKLALVVVFGNENVRAASNPVLRKVAASTDASIADYVAVDYVNPWPTFAPRPHRRSPDATQSGFEHSVCFADVGSVWAAYVELFGGFRFVVRLGSASGLRPCGIAINPRSRKVARFDGDLTGLDTSIPLLIAADPVHKAKTQEGLRAALSRVADAWQSESTTADAQLWSDDLLARTQGMGSGELDKAIHEWTERLAEVKFGKGWTEDIDLPFDEDQG